MTRPPCIQGFSIEEATFTLNFNTNYPEPPIRIIRAKLDELREQISHSFIKYGDLLGAQ